MEEQFKEIISRQSRIIALMFVVILILLCTLFLNECQRNYQEPVTPQQIPAGAPPAGARLNDKLAREITRMEGDSEKGMKLFKRNCAVCHTTGTQKLTGPGLKGIFDRVPKPADQWLIKFILNNEALRRSGDPYAKKIYEENNKAQMTVFEGQLSEEEIRNIIFYIAAADNL